MEVSAFRGKVFFYYKSMFSVVPHCSSNVCELYLISAYHSSKSSGSLSCPNIDLDTTAYSIVLYVLTKTSIDVLKSLHIRTITSGFKREIWIMLLMLEIFLWNSIFFQERNNNLYWICVIVLDGSCCLNSVSLSYYYKHCYNLR